MKLTVKNYGGNRQYVYYFVDPDLRVEIILKKAGTAENGGIDYEIGDIGTSAHWYWRLKKISCGACLLFYYFFDKKKELLKAGFWPVLSFVHYCILLIFLAAIQNRGKDAH